MLSIEEAKNLIAFLDRVPITGHKERAAMNEIASKLVLIISQEDKEEDNENFPA